MLFQNKNDLYHICLVAVEARMLLNTPLDDTVLISVFRYSKIN